MRICTVYAVLAAALLTLGAGRTARAGEAALAQKLKETYAGYQNMSMEFTLDIFWRVREKSESKTGSLTVARGDKFRLELGPTQWISDGVLYWQYHTPNKQVVIKRLLDVDLGMHPSHLLETYLTRCSFAVLNQDDKTATLQWENNGQTQGAGENRSVTLWVDVKKSQIRKMLVVDKNGNESTYTFKKTEFNVPLPADFFTFTPPQGATVLDTRE